MAVLLALWRRSDLYERFAYFDVTLVAVSTACAGFWASGITLRFEGDTPYVGVRIFVGISLLLLSSVTALARRRSPDLLWNGSSRLLCVTAYAGCFLLAAVLGFVGGSILYGF